MTLESCYVPYTTVERIGVGCALILAPHPDDEVLGCFGALSSHVVHGDRVRVVVATDGAFGVQKAKMRDYAQTRQSESCAAAALSGYPEPIFWGLPDRGLTADEGLIERIEAEIDAVGAAWVYTPSWWEVHPDHCALAMAATEATRRRGGERQLVQYEVGVPLQPNCLLDITAILEAKRRAIACFSSQLSRQAYDNHVLALNGFRAYTLQPYVKAAEAYRVTAAVDLPIACRCPLMARLGELPIGLE